VDDDGRGFDPDRPAATGQGLDNLRERAQRLGGHTEVQSIPGQGARVQVTIPH
jgi:two-component system, NarL family, sensor histidine kinase LiaS